MKLKNEYIKLTPQERLYNLKQPIIALTGGIASGKSTVANIFATNGIKVINADELVKKIYDKKETLEFIRSVASDTITNEKINFPKLREKVFNNPTLKESIEKYIYQRLPEMFKSQVSDDDEAIIYDVPLLYERQLESFFDQVIVVYVPKSTQLERLIQRDNNTQELAEKIINLQIDIELKRQKANFVLNNLATQEELKQKTLELLNKLFI